jgi:hypothetical protein
MTAVIRDFRSDDATAVNRVALAARNQYRGLFPDWARSEAIFANAASLATKFEHTSPAMSVALSLYLRLGFVHHRDIADRNGLPYAVYTLTL